MPKVSTNGIDLYYEIHGSGEPLLLIHGLGSSTRDWEYQIPDFSKSYQVITFDLRGHGQSEKPRHPYSIPQFAADAAGLLRSLETGPAHIVGLSLGGAIALQLAIDSPQSVHTLTIVNSTPEFIIRSLKHRIMLWQRMLIPQWLGMRTLGELLAKRLFVKPEHEHLRQTFAERWAENDKPSYLNTLRSMIGWSVTTKLNSIEIPTLIVAAEHDYFPLPQIERHFASMPDARLTVIPDTHHALPAENPHAFNRVVIDFLAESRNEESS